MSWVAWRDAWDQALYAAGRGFYVTRGGPAAHFTTAAHGPSGAVLAEALLRLWERHRPGTLPSLVVDVGAGRGELATQLASSLEPPSVGVGGPRVLAVDVVERPEELDERVEWLRSPGGARLPDRLTDLAEALVVAHEWLDVVPCTIAEVRSDGVLVEVLVDPATGAERLGPPLSDEDLEWADLHWPDREPGDRVEIGATRDAAWADLVSRVGSGLLVAVDYGHSSSERPSGGTLAAYQEGRQRHPVPDGTCDLTAHVAMDSLDADEVTLQRPLLRSLGVTGALPDHALAQRDPLGYLRALERASAEARLVDPAGFGGFWWAVRDVQGHHVP